jgi:hypothetical protein
MEKSIKGNSRMFCLINSTNYPWCKLDGNYEGSYSVMVLNINELPDYGFSDKQMEEIDKMEVDETYNGDYDGCYVIRIA